MDNKFVKILLSIFLAGAISVTVVACNNSSDELKSGNTIIKEEAEDEEKVSDKDDTDDQEDENVTDGSQLEKDDNGQEAEEGEEKDDQVPEQEKILVKTNDANIESIIRNYTTLLSNLTEDESIPLEYIKRTTGSDDFYKEAIEKIKSLRASNKVYNANNINILEVYQLSGEKDVYYARVSQEENGIVKNYEYKIIYSNSSSGVVSIREI